LTRRSGVFRVVLGCRTSTGARCTTTLGIRFDAPNDALAPISLTVHARSGQHRLVYLVASRAERRAIRRIHPLTVTLTATNPFGTRVSRTVTFNR
jgi:hypothetical protein